MDVYGANGSSYPSFYSSLKRVPHLLILSGDSWIRSITHNERFFSSFQCFILSHVHSHLWNVFTWWPQSWIIIKLKRCYCISFIFIIIVIVIVIRKRISISKISQNRMSFTYEHVTHLKTISLDGGSDTIVSESINVPRRSMQGLLFSFTSSMLLMGEKVRRHSILTSLKWRWLSVESQISFTVKEWRQEICGKRPSEDLEEKTARWMQQTFMLLFWLISGVWVTMVFLKVGWDWWIW